MSVRSRAWPPAGPGRVPTGVILWGTADRIIPVEHGYAVHEARQGSRLEVLAGVGHFPHVERPGEVVDLINDFINTTTQATDATRLRDNR